MKVLSVVMAVVGLSFLAGCGKPVAADPGTPEATGPAPIKVEPDMDANNFIVAHLERFPLATANQYVAAPELNVTGVVNPDISKQVPVPSLATGRIVEIDARLGDEVKKGQLLFKVRSTNISGAYSDYRQAVKNEELTKIQLNRAKILFEDGAIPKSTMETAQNAEDDAQIVLETAKEHLQVLGANPDHPTGIAPSTGPTEGTRISNQARIILCSWPEVIQCTSQVGRPDDGTDTAGFFNTEYFVDLKPKEQWRSAFHQNKELVIAAMNRELEKIPGVIWNFSQPIADNMEEAVSGVKGQLATKVYGDDLKLLEDLSDQTVAVMRKVKGIEDLGVFHVLGQPNENFVVDRRQAARYQINVADVQDAIQTAAGGNALTQVLKGEARYDLVMRYLPKFRNTKEALEQIRLLAPTGERVSLAQLCKVEERDGGSEIYREANQRHVAIKYSVRGRDLGGAVEEAIKSVNAKVQLPRGYHIDWEGEYQSELRAEARLNIIVPLTILLIFVILYSMFRSFKWAILIMLNVILARIGGLLALLITHTNFSVSSGVGFLALFGVSVQTGVIMLEYINQMRTRGHNVEDSAVEGAVLRLRPIMMTMFVATLGLLPAAMSHGIGSDSQRPFAIVIVGGLISDLLMSIFLLPTLYVWMAGEHDVLPKREAEFDEAV